MLIRLSLDFIFTNYEDIFYGCVKSLPDLCTSFATYISSLKFVFIVWLITLVVGFLVALFLAFCVSTLQMQVVLFLLCTIPFWTSNVIRMISWIPLLGRNGLVNSTLQNIGLIDARLNGFYIHNSRLFWPLSICIPCSWSSPSLTL